jgi:hypothetical protein
MDDEYIYRLDYTSKLKAFPDGCHRAPRWHGGPKSFPHRLLRSQLAQLSSSQAIYRICFFSTLVKAQQTRLTYEEHGKTTTLARCRKTDVLAAGFTDSWDDGFAPGDAHLFWIVENVTDDNCSLSVASIPFERFEALVDGRWKPLAAHLAPLSAPPPPQAGLKVSAQPSLLSRLATALLSK